jgi:alpha-tubulin suppressor-like RCC1 family protein
MKTLSKLLVVLLFVTAGIKSTAQCWKMVRTGANHCIAIKNDGTLWAWGSNSDGQLGNGGTSDIWTPYQIGVDNDWSTVGTGKSSTHNLAIKENGTLWAWGYNFYGQLGITPGDEELLPIQVGTDTNWSKVACGMFFSIAIKTDGTLWGWGSNNFGQVDDYNNNSFVQGPTLISSDTTWAELSCGDAHSLALKTNGDLYGWGFNFSGMVGNGNSGVGSESPLVHVATSDAWISIAAGDSHSVAVRSDNTLWSWGVSSSGELGNGVLYSQNSLPVQVGTETNWLKVFSGEYFSLGIKTDGTLWAWGANGYGELGVGNNEQQLTPVQVGTDNNWVTAQGGRQHCIGLKEDGHAMTWGRNTYGTLGNGTGDDIDVHSNVPIDLLCVPVGMDESFSNTTLSIYPNPAKDRIHFTIPDGEQIVQASIYNALGMLVYTQNVQGSAIAIDSFASGSYMLVISTNSGRLVNSFVKE